MSGIPVYTQSPIKAAKPDATTPQTAAPTPSHTAAPAHTPATTTTAAAAPSPYPPAQPAQHVGGSIPTATASANHAPAGPAHKYSPPTTTAPYDAPPPPQPGAAPTVKSALPPPPKTGERYVPPARAPAQVPVGYPAQTTTAPYEGPPPPQPGAAPTVRSALPPPPKTGERYVPPEPAPAQAPVGYPAPTTRLPALGLGGGVGAHGGVRRSFEHPPGYQQNPYASDRPMEQQHDASVAEGGGGGQWHQAGSLEDVADEGSVWETAKKWAYSAGEKMAETEAGIWRRVNGEK